MLNPDIALPASGPWLERLRCRAAVPNANERMEGEMEWQELIIDGYGRVAQVLQKALDGLAADDLERQPHPDANSIGWLAWHTSRVQDHEVAALMGEEQLWLKDGWHARFGRPADPHDSGFGHTSEDVSAFKSPDVGTLLAYHRAVLERTERYVNSLSAADLDRKLEEPWFQPLPTVGVRLVSVMSDSLQHVGQVAYLRGLFKGRGWQGA